MQTPRQLSLRSIPGIPLIAPGDDLAVIIKQRIDALGESLLDGDVVVVAQKIVSKAEGRLVDLSNVEPSERALELARTVDKDPRVVELILSESVEVLRAVNGVLITENRYGLVMANAGLDMSNVEHSVEDGAALLLPVDPDDSADRIRAGLERSSGATLGVVVCDSVGRAWREATVGLAIGVSGMPARLDLRGDTDLFGRELRVSEVGLGDALASAASLLMGEGSEGFPVVLVRGFSPDREHGRARDLVRPKERDLFR